jgi:hypothetical protein
MIELMGSLLELDSNFVGMGFKFCWRRTQILFFSVGIGWIVIGIGWIVIGIGWIVIGIGWIVIGIGWIVIGIGWIVIGIGFEFYFIYLC